SWGISDHLADGEGFSYAEIGVAKLFTELGYPGEYQNFGLADSRLYGDLHQIIAYCGYYIVMLSKAYSEADPASLHGIKVVNKNTLELSGSMNLGSIQAADLKLISSDYKGTCVGMVVRNGETEFFTWDTPSSAPISIGKVNVNMASMSDGGSNFQVSGDVKTKAWITAAGPRSSAGLHYRIQVIDGKLA